MAHRQPHDEQPLPRREFPDERQRLPEWLVGDEEGQRAAAMQFQRTQSPEIIPCYLAGEPERHGYAGLHAEKFPRVEKTFSRHHPNAAEKYGRRRFYQPHQQMSRREPFGFSEPYVSPPHHEYSDPSWYRSAPQPYSPTSPAFLPPPRDPRRDVSIPPYGGPDFFRVPPPPTSFIPSGRDPFDALDAERQRAAAAPAPIPGYFPYPAASSPFAPKPSATCILPVVLVASPFTPPLGAEVSQDFVLAPEDAAPCFHIRGAGGNGVAESLALLGGKILATYLTEYLLENAARPINNTTAAPPREGQITAELALYVSNSTLARVAELKGFAAEMSSHGTPHTKYSDKELCTIMEALVGRVAMCHGIDTVRAVVRKIATWCDAAKPHTVPAMTRFVEYWQSLGLRPPTITIKAYPREGGGMMYKGFLYDNGDTILANGTLKPTKAEAKADAAEDALRKVAAGTDPKRFV